MDIEFNYDDHLRAVPKQPHVFKKYIEKLKEDLSNAEGKERVSILGRLGACLGIDERLNEAESLLLEALDIIKKESLGLKVEIQQKIRLGHIWQLSKDFTKSNELFSEILEQCDTMDALQTLRAFALQHSGKNLFDQGKFSEALNLFERALALRRADRSPEDQIQSTLKAISRSKELLAQE